MDNGISVHIKTPVYENEVFLHETALSNPLECFNELIKVLNNNTSGEIKY